MKKSMKLALQIKNTLNVLNPYYKYVADKAFDILLVLLTLEIFGTLFPKLYISPETGFRVLSNTSCSLSFVIASNCVSSTLWRAKCGRYSFALAFNSVSTTNTSSRFSWTKIKGYLIRFSLVRTFFETKSWAFHLLSAQNLFLFYVSL